VAEEIVLRSKKGQAIRPERKTPAEMKALRAVLDGAKRAGNLETWRRAKAVLGYIGGTAVISLSEKLDVTDRSIAGCNGTTRREPLDYGQGRHRAEWRS
jgi:hypothetical protein